MNENLHPGLTIRLYKAEKCFGPGVATLLELVQSLHSLRSAAMTMNMAYSKAWTIVKHAERELGFSLVVGSAGGKGGGGTILTPNAERLLTLYRQYCAKVNAFAALEFQAMFSEFSEQDSFSV